MIRKHKIYSRPRKAFDKNRIEAENKLVARYGLKSKREIWKADSAVGIIRNRAKSLITSDTGEQNKLIDKLNKMGLKVGRIADILALEKEDLLKRRLQSIVFEKKIASTPKAARQLIVHKHIAIDDNIVNIPSYIVPVSEEGSISVVKLRAKVKKQKNTEGVIEHPEI